RGADEQWKAKFVQLVKTRQQWIVAFKFLAKSKAWIEHDAPLLDAVVNRRFRPVDEIYFHFRNDVRRWWKSAPLFRSSSTVHEHDAAFEVGYGLSHLRVPMKSTHIVHDLCSGIYGGAGDLGLISVHGQYGVRTLPQNIFNHGHDAVQFFLCRYAGFANFGSR